MQWITWMQRLTYISNIRMFTCYFIFESIDIDITGNSIRQWVFFYVISLYVINGVTWSICWFECNLCLLFVHLFYIYIYIVVRLEIPSLTQWNHNVFYTNCVCVFCVLNDLNKMTTRESNFEENNSTGCSILWHSISPFPL